MKVYLAAPYTEKMRMQEVRKLLTGHGYTVTSRWIDGFNAPGVVPRQYAALVDLDDIDEARAFMCFPARPGIYTTGGNHVELGYAIAKNKYIFLIGERVNVFHHLDEVVICGDVQDAIRCMGLVA